MKYQPLSTQSYWEDKARQEIRIVRRQQAWATVKTFFLYSICCSLMLAAFLGYVTHETWLPSAAAEFESILNAAPAKYVNSEVLTKATS